jgi:hypothetical protein
MEFYIFGRNSGNANTCRWLCYTKQVSYIVVPIHAFVMEAAVSPTNGELHLGLQCLV